MTLINFFIYFNINLGPNDEVGVRVLLCQRWWCTQNASDEELAFILLGVSSFRSFARSAHWLHVRLILAYPCLVGVLVCGCGCG